MILDRVTITGADDSVTAKQMLDISDEYPFVEWGILYSRSNQGQPRYPSGEWLKDQLPLLMGRRLSAHLCGWYVRNVVLEADAGWWAMAGQTTHMFQRIQLNFHGQFHNAHERFKAVMMSCPQSFILQFDGVNDDAAKQLLQHDKIVPLFDRSGGAGELPTEWPVPVPGKYCGYAGGLGPQNVGQQLEKIYVGCKERDRIWIDMERNVRTEDDAKLDLYKVVRVLETCSQFASY